MGWYQEVVTSGIDTVVPGTQAVISEEVSVGLVAVCSAGRVNSPLSPGGLLSETCYMLSGDCFKVYV